MGGCLVRASGNHGPVRSTGRAHNAKQSVTGRLCQYYIMDTKFILNVHYKCPLEANFFLEMVVIVNFSHVFDEVTFGLPLKLEGPWPYEGYLQGVTRAHQA